MAYLSCRCLVGCCFAIEDEFCYLMPFDVEGVKRLDVFVYGCDPLASDCSSVEQPVSAVGCPHDACEELLAVLLLEMLHIAMVVASFLPESHLVECGKSEPSWNRAVSADDELCDATIEHRDGLRFRCFHAPCLRIPLGWLFSLRDYCIGFAWVCQVIGLVFAYSFPRKNIESVGSLFVFG